jgi:methionyl-tRNA synthetase
MNEQAARRLKAADEIPSVAIIAPPPTPNGDLHLGHLSGPYLWADVVQRYLRLRGQKCVSALSVDLNQTYVVTTAERLRITPTELAQRSYADIQSTLGAADMLFDVVGMPDAGYTAYVKDWFVRLGKAGVFDRRETAIPYHVNSGRFLFEAYASGWCPTCLSDTKANICETCGHPNDAAKLFNLHATGGRVGDPLETRSQRGYVFQLEKWRQPLEHHLLKTIPHVRPALLRLVKELLDAPLPAFPITFPSQWGIPAPFADSEGLVLNVWAEMVPGHYYWLERAHAANGGTSPLISGTAPVSYLQFLGFDNSFFYAVAHLALAFAARDAGVDALIPDTFIVNEFYQLDSSKFSTSQSHAIWGREFLASQSADETRFYLAWSNPELQQSNFTRTEFEAVVARKLREPLRRLQERLVRLKASPARSDDRDPLADALLARFDAAYTPRNPSLRVAAVALANGLDVAVSRAESATDLTDLRGYLTALSIGAAPLIPRTAQALWRSAGHDLPMSWSTAMRPSRYKRVDALAS